MMYNPLQLIAIAVWCLTLLLLVVGIREVVKLRPREKPLPTRASEEITRVLRVPSGARAVVSPVYLMKTVHSAHEELWHSARGAVVERKRVGSFGYRAEVQIVDKRKGVAFAPGRGADWMKKHNDRLSVAGEA